MPTVADVKHKTLTLKPPPPSIVTHDRGEVKASKAKEFNPQPNPSSKGPSKLHTKTLRSMEIGRDHKQKDKNNSPATLSNPGVKARIKVAKDQVWTPKQPDPRMRKGPVSHQTTLTALWGGGVSKLKEQQIELNQVGRKGKGTSNIVRTIVKTPAASESRDVGANTQGTHGSV